MENQASIREFFGRLQAASNGNAQLPWELLHTTPAVANRTASISGAPALSRTTANAGNDYGVGLPPTAG
jgi:hypothetical protein